MISPERVHEATQSAPIDALLYRQARAAIACVMADLRQRSVDDVAARDGAQLVDLVHYLRAELLCARERNAQLCQQITEFTQALGRQKGSSS